MSSKIHERIDELDEYERFLLQALIQKAEDEAGKRLSLSSSLVGFGTFEVKSRAERTGRNPQTGAAMTIPAARVPAFRAGKVIFHR